MFEHLSSLQMMLCRAAAVKSLSEHRYSTDYIYSGPYSFLIISKLDYCLSRCYGVPRRGVTGGFL